MNKNIETYIFVHDQNIIVEYEKNNKFHGFSNYKYVFLGFGDIDKLSQFSNIIIARDLEFNLEKYGKMCAYSGWYALYINEIIGGDYVNLFEYDVTLHENFVNILEENISQDFNIYSYVPVSSNMEFINNPKWVSDLFKYYKIKENIDIEKILHNKIIENNIQIWASTSNLTFNTDFFYQYMNDVNPIFYWMKQWNSVGHGLERLVSIYLILNNITNIQYFSGLIKHYQLDSHKTQDHAPNFDYSLKRLIKNE